MVAYTERDPDVRRGRDRFACRRPVSLVVGAPTLQENRDVRERSRTFAVNSDIASVCTRVEKDLGTCAARGRVPSMRQIGEDETSLADDRPEVGCIEIGEGDSVCMAQKTKSRTRP
jgi:hypothetical protein